MVRLPYRRSNLKIRKVPVTVKRGTITIYGSKQLAPTRADLVGHDRRAKPLPLPCHTFSFEYSEFRETNCTIFSCPRNSWCGTGSTQAHGASHPCVPSQVFLNVPSLSSPITYQSVATSGIDDDDDTTHHGRLGASIVLGRCTRQQRSSGWWQPIWHIWSLYEK